MPASFRLHSALYAVGMRLMLTGCLVLGAAAVFYAADNPKLPPPFATPSVRNTPRVIPQPADAKLNLPAGFTMDIWAEGFKVPRYMMLGPSNEILMTDAARTGGAVYVFQGKERKAIIENLSRPYGLALNGGFLYVGTPESIMRYKYDPKAMTASAGQEIISLKGFGAGHWTRSLLFDPAGKKLYVGIGSGSNVSPGEDPRRATISRYNPDGTGGEIYASGHATPQPSIGIPVPTPSGPPCRNAMNSATTLSPTTSPTSNRAAFMDGRTPSPAPTRIRVTRA